MHAQRRHHLDRRLLDPRVLPLDLHLSQTATDIKQLSQVCMAMRADLPIVQATARGDGLAVQQVGRRPVGAVSIELEYGNRRMGVAGLHRQCSCCALIEPSL